MMKRIVLFFIWICGLSGMVSAQVETNTRILKQAAVDYKIAGDANYSKALTLAKQRGWPLTIKGKEGKMATLVGVDNMGFPKYIVTFSNTIAAATTRANQLWPGGASGLNLSGSSANMKNKIGIWDEGKVLETHVELTGRVTQKDFPSVSSDHSTHVSGTLIASGVNPSAKGMAYGVQGLIAYDFKNFLSEMFNESSNLLVSNHSYGSLAGWQYNSSETRWEFFGLPDDNEDYKFGYYSDVAQALDSIAYNAPLYLIVMSAGNNRSETGPAVGDPYFRLNASGQQVSAGNRLAGISSNDSYDCIPQYNGAKNVLTVGAVSGIPAGYTSKNDVVMSNFSSWGPTDDGRIKPDIVADGVAVLSPIAASNTSYASFSGTSMASPNAAGSLFLLQEYYSKLKTGAFLSAATIKGLAIHTAEEAGPFPGPDYQFGWGLLNVEKAAAVITAAVISNNAATSAHQLYEKILTQGQTFTTTVVASGKQPLSATISWTDPKGMVDTNNLLNNRAKKLVNDLDIRITTGTGASLRTFLPWTLNVNNPSAAAVPGDNITDNVERINVTDSTIPGQTYTITVTHKGTTLTRGSQAYSLLVSGTGGTAYCASAPTNSAGGRIDSVSFKNIHFSNPAGATTYTNNTNLIADIEPSQTIPVFVKLGSSDGTAANKIVKVFIDFNNNGVFDASEMVATNSSVITNGNFLSTITTPTTLTVGNISLMRIVVEETSTASDVTACSNANYSKGETQDYRVRVVSPSVDMSISEIVSPAAADCSNGAQYITIKIKNNGTIDQTNIPVTVAVSTGATTVANLSAVYPGTITALNSVNYTFQTPFISNSGATYSITATVTLANDQNPFNNQLVSTIATTVKPATISPIGSICTTTAFLRINNPDASNYFWYATPTNGFPFAVGSTANTTTIPSDKTYYVAKEARASLGPLTKLAFPQGGYNSFFGNYVKFNNTIPIIIETARLYIGNPGKIKITVADLISTTSTGFTYRVISAITLDAYATNPNPAPGAVAGNLTTDLGAVYYLNLPVPSVGDHIIILECSSGSGRSDSASIFRNNQITGGTTYPMNIPNIASITGNSVTSASGFTESQFYYFYYDMQINTGACISDRVSVIAVTAPTPVISQVSDSLISSIAGGNQWYLNDTAINNAITNHFKPAKPGTYKVIVTDVFGCQKISNNIVFAVTAIADVLAREIKLNVSPNPNNGVFNLSFEVTTKADLSIDIVSSSGQRVFNSTYANFTGKFSKQIRVDAVSSAFYVLKIQHNKKTYLQKLIIVR